MARHRSLTPPPKTMTSYVDDPLGRINCLEKDPYESTVCRSLFRKIGIASNRIDEMKRSKDQKLSTLNLLTLRTIYKFFQIHFPGPYWLFWRICLQNLVFEISCVWEDLATFQKPLFWTPDITPHPSPALVFHVIFVEPKTASREPCRVNKRMFFLLQKCFKKSRLNLGQNRNPERPEIEFL